MAPGPAIVERLRQALAAASPGANRFVIHEVIPSPLEQYVPPPSGEGRVGAFPISVATVPITDTCKEVVDGLVRRTVPRETLVEARGPWLITREGLVDTLARAVAREGEITDMLSLCEAAGVRVSILPRK
ncbi:MAG: hypothetical protein E6H90_09270 [Chloroflexi bacterium]|nr:MAG: hypothetical protein E6H90_09270 [Chloroflexota bacterium]